MVENEQFQGDPELRLCAERFYEDLRQSGRFSWLGVFTTEDVLRRPRMVMFLRRRPDWGKLASRGQWRRNSRLVDNFVDLHRAMREVHGLPIDMFYDASSVDETHLAERKLLFIQRLYGGMGREVPAELVYEESFAVE